MKILTPVTDDPEKSEGKSKTSPILNNEDDGEDEGEDRVEYIAKLKQVIATQDAAMAKYKKQEKELKNLKKQNVEILSIRICKNY
jgi:hypothetical protein